MRRILFVCTGNICRSPTADGLLRHRLAERGITHITVDSAGTHSYHIGEAPDPRSIRTARAHGVEIGQLRARQITPEDFTDFDLILAMDRGHLRHMQQIAPAHTKAELALFMAHAKHPGPQDVADPYYGTAADFTQCFQQIDEGIALLLARLLA